MSDAPSPIQDLRDPARTLFRWFVGLLFFVAIVLVITTFVGALLKGIALDTAQQHGDTAWLSAAAESLSAFNTFLNQFISRFWTFLAPLLSIAILLLIVDWFLRRIGIRISGVEDLKATNVQAIIAIVVIGSLCLASFVNSEAANILKDIALVVVG